MRCPICKKPLADAERGPAAQKHFPFCSERCKLIDLGRWLDGKYQVPVVEQNESSRQPTNTAQED